MKNLIFAVIFLTGSAIADDLTIPNTFQAGTPARAADVNANFTAVEASVDDNAANIAANTGDISTNGQNITDNIALISTNAAAIQTNSDEIATVAAAGPALVKANGQTIGIFLQGEPVSGAGILFDSVRFWTLSDTGYMFAVATHNTTPPNPRNAGDVNSEPVWFDGPNCTGTAYSTALDPVRQAQFFSGYVFAPWDPNDPVPTYYSPTNSPVLANVSTQSRGDRDTSCQPAVGTLTFAVEVFPNDPLITGVANQRNLGAPITLGR